MECLQIRYELPNGEDLKSFEYGGLAYEIMGASANRDLISGGNPLFPRRQYTAIASDGGFYEVYVYYYSSFGNGRWYAVVDAICPAANTHITKRSGRAC